MQINDPFEGQSRMMKTNTTTKQSMRRRGWTFIELLATITILAIASVLLVPTASSGASASGQSATRHVVTDILAAQMDAVAQQEFRRIHFFADGSGWCVEVLTSGQLATPFDSGTAQYADDETESQGNNQKTYVDFTKDTRYNNMSIGSPLFDASHASVIFDQTGGIIAPNGSPSTGGSFEVQSGEHVWRINLAPLTGKVTVTKIGGAK